MDGDRKILSLRFNQDQGCFSCSMESGVRIYNVEPLVEKCHYDIETVGSVSKCEMLYRTNLIAIVSGGTRPMFSDNILLIFDDLLKKFILEITFSSSIQAVRLRKDKIIVALLTNIHVFSFPSPTQRLFSLETIKNPRGLCELSPLAAGDKQILIFPGHKTGSVQILDLASTEIGISSAPVWISAHKGELACLTFNQQATKIATASVQALTLAAIQSTYVAQVTKELYIFLLLKIQHGINECCIIPSTNIFGKYANSKWALATFTVPPERACICAFTQNNSVIIAVCLDGTFHKYVFNQDGNCNRDGFDVFLDVYDDDENLL
ncbi:WD repeat domain phosphoinositide-interacting protein 4 [Asbolus verrucosus]|uniref:WD repeat domain phosphoinositide-interacting protein 4 n=1 Tax=Asbolus verrucosus TaxID=1661398 RepID=A0A482VW26_ASBVE|nr:WD repeat domain phosphoinositide-interacting protein 4 [Asbolus verrucosus]